MFKESRQKLAEKGITWKEKYTDKTEFLKEQFEDTVGPGSYFRFEGESPDGDEYYCIIGPAGIHRPRAKFFAGVRKLPATFSAGGKYFDSLDTAARYARETWGIDTPKDLKPYTQKQLFGIAKKVKKWKEERREENDSEKEDKDEKSAFSFPVNDLSKFSFTINDLTSESENFNVTYLNKEAMGAPKQRFRSGYQWITLEAAIAGESVAFNQLLEGNGSMQSAIQDIKMEKMKRICLMRQKYNISLTDAIKMMKFYLGFSRKHGLYMRIYAPYCMSPKNYSDLYSGLVSYFRFTNRTKGEFENLGFYTNNLFETSKELMTEIINKQPSDFANTVQTYCINSPGLQAYFPNNPNEINVDVKKCPLLFYTKLLSWYNKNHTKVEWKGQIFWKKYATIFLNDLKRKLSLHYSDTRNIFSIFDKAYPIASSGELIKKSRQKLPELKSAEEKVAETELSELSFEEIKQHMEENNGVPPVSKLGLDCYSFVNLTTPQYHTKTEDPNSPNFYKRDFQIQYSNEHSAFTKEVISYLPSRDPNNGIYSFSDFENIAQQDNVVLTPETIFFINRDGIKKMILNLIAQNQQIFNDENLTRDFLSYMKNYLSTNVAATTHTNLFTGNFPDRITSDLKTFIYFVTGINSGLNNAQIEELENLSNSSFERFNRAYPSNVQNARDIQKLQEGVNPFENGTLNYDIVMPQKLSTKEFYAINRRRFQLTTSNILGGIVKAMVQFIKENEGNEYCSELLILNTSPKSRCSNAEPGLAKANSSLNQSYNRFLPRKAIQIEISSLMRIEDINVINQDNINKLFTIMNEFGGLNSFKQRSPIAYTNGQRNAIKSDLREQGLDEGRINRATNHEKNRVKRNEAYRAGSPIFTKQTIKTLMLEVLTPTIVTTACNIINQNNVNYNNEEEFNTQCDPIIRGFYHFNDKNVKLLKIKVLEYLKNDGPNIIISLEEQVKNIESEFKIMKESFKEKQLSSSDDDANDEYIANVSIDAETGEIYQSGFFPSLRSCIEANKYLWEIMEIPEDSVIEDEVSKARFPIANLDDDNIIGRASIIDTGYSSSVLSNIVSNLDRNLIESYRRTRSNPTITVLLRSLQANDQAVFDQINQGDLDYQLETGEIIKEDLEITLEEIEEEETEEEVIEVPVDTNNFSKEINNAINQERNYQNFVRLVTAIQQYPVSDNPDRSVNINVNYDSNLFWNIIGLLSNGKNISEDHKNIIINNFPQSMQFYLDGPQEEITLQQQEAEEELPEEEDEYPFAIQEGEDPFADQFADPDDDNVRNAKNNTVRNIIKLSSQLDKEGKSKQSIELLEIAKRILRKKDK